MTVSRREITLRWRGRQGATGAPINLPSDSNILILPLEDQLPDEADGDGFFGYFADAQYPGRGFLIESPGFSPIVIAHDGTQTATIARFASDIEDILKHSTGYGLSQYLALSDNQGRAQADETIVIHVRSSALNVERQASYANLGNYILE